MNTCKVVAYGCGLLLSFSTLAVEFGDAANLLI